MRLILFLLRRSPRTLAIASLGAAAAGVATTGLVALINVLVAETATDVGRRAVVFVSLCLLVLLTHVGSEALLIRLIQRSVYELRMGLATEVAAIDLQHFEELGAPRTLAALTDDVMALSVGLGALPMVATNGAVVVACLAYLGWLSPPMLLVLLAFMGLAMVSHRLPERRAQAATVRARIAQHAVLSHIRALTEGSKEVRLSRARRDAVLGELGVSAGTYRDESSTSALAYALAGTWGQLLFFIGIGLVLALGASVLGVATATLPSFALVIVYMMGPLRIVLGTLPLFGRAAAALHGLLAMRLRAAEEAPRAEEPAQEGRRWGELELAGVTFAYDGFVLGPIDLTLRAGELVLLAGGNGSGKSTLGKVLTGLYRPTGGEIRVAGRRVADAEGEWYRSHFAAVFADAYVFDKLPGPASSERDEQARLLLRRLELAERVTIEGGAFSTTALSDGQKKRLALVGAYLEDRPVYVFDEWAANQDPAFKALFYRELLPELRARGKAILAITHDDRYFDVADRLVELEDGRVRVRRGNAA